VSALIKPPKPPSAAALERRVACEALSAVQATRPLKPPPFRFEGHRTTAGARALARDKKAGVA
jgi:hypothetical protein